MIVGEVLEKVNTIYAENPNMVHKKVRTTVYISEMIKTIAELMGLNLSQVLEQAVIREAERRLEIIQNTHALVNSSPGRIRTGVAGSRVRQD